MALSATCLWASLSDLKPWLGLTASDVAHDAMLEQRANAVTEELERETGRIYVSRSITERLDGLGTAVLALRGYPNVSISAFARDGEAVSSDDYVLDADAGLIWRKAGAWGRPATDRLNAWDSAVGLYSVTYTAGYARASLPALVLQVGVDLLRARYLTWGNNADVFSYQAQAGGGVIQPVADWVSIRKQLDLLKYEYRVGVA